MKAGVVLALLSLSCVSFAIAGRNLSADDDEATDRLSAVPCRVDFENVDFSILTSSCESSKMRYESCCPQFDSMVKPYVEDLSTNIACADELFKELDARGYEASALDNLCHGEKKGLLEDTTSPKSAASPAPASSSKPTPSSAPALSVRPFLQYAALVLVAGAALV